jgi:hypothetical protein
MYKVSAIYTPPRGQELWFDHNYYGNVHVPMMNRDFPGKVPFVAVDLDLGVETLVRTTVADGTATSAKPSAPCVVAPLIANIYFENRTDAYEFADFVTSSDAAALHADVVKYTNCDIHWTVGELHKPG